MPGAGPGRDRKGGDTILGLIDTLWKAAERALEGAMALFLLAMALITAVDVAGRYLFNAPLAGGYEIVQYLMALSVFAALPLVTRAESQLTISLFTQRLRGGAARVHRVAVLVVSGAALALLAWRMGAQAAVMARSGAASGSLGLPLAPIAWAMTALAWFSVAVACVLVLQAVLGRDAGPAQPKSVLE